MAQDHPLARRGEDHVMLADDIRAADGAESDGAPFAGAGDALTRGGAQCVQRLAATVGGGFAQHQRGPRRRVHLAVVMRLDHLDIPVLAQCGGDLAGQADQQAHAKAHVAGADDRRMAGGGFQFVQICGFKAGGADHMHGTGLRSQFRKSHGRRRSGKVDHGLRLGDGLDRIVGDGDSQGRAAHRLAQIAAHPGAALALDGADKSGLI